MLETPFRQTVVIPFLKTLRNTVAFPVQQVGISGTPDFLLCMSGLFVALELKGDGGRLSKLQDFNLKQVRKKGKGLAIVASPENWIAVTYLLSKLDQGEKCD